MFPIFVHSVLTNDCNLPSYVGWSWRDLASVMHGSVHFSCIVEGPLNNRVSGNASAQKIINEFRVCKVKLSSKVGFTSFSLHGNIMYRI